MTVEALLREALEQRLSVEMRRVNDRSLDAPVPGAPVFCVNMCRADDDKLLQGHGRKADLADAIREAIDDVKDVRERR